MAVKEVTFDYLAQQYCEKHDITPEALLKILLDQKQRYQPLGFFLAECRMLDSSRCGQYVILPYGGQDNTFKTVPKSPFSPRGLASDMSVAIMYCSADLPGTAAPWAGVKMKIELKNVKHAKFASQETECFEATVYINDEKAGIVSNTGHGGPHSFHPLSLEAKLNEYAKTLPPRKWRDVGIDQDGDYPHSGETVISDLLARWLLAKDLKRLLRKYVFTQKNTKGIYSLRERPAVKPLAVDKVLNDLPFEEALDLYLQHG